MKTAELNYRLPPELIAQHPADRRDASRLLVYDRTSRAVRHRVFADLPDELHGELVVVNDTRVLPARIPIEQPRGEVLLLERREDGLREHFRPSARHLAEVRGLMNQVIGRLERLEGDLLAERHGRVDDLALLVDLIASGWQTVNDRLANIEQALGPHANVVELNERRESA